MKRMSTVLRELLAGDEILVCPGIYDALSARIAERAGFKVVGLGGYAMGANLGMGEPLMSLDDLTTACRYVTAAINIPLRVDAGAGYGEPLHVMRTIRQLEVAGVAAAHIEDQIFPKRAHYHKCVEHLIDADDMVMKIRAAVTARRDPDLVIIARTDAMLTEGFAEGVRRANLYLDAGADMAHVFPNNMEEAREAPKLIHGPLSVMISEAHRLNRPVFSFQDAKAMGYKMASYGVSGVMAAAKGVKEMMIRLRDTGYTGFTPEESKAARQEVEDCVGLDAMYALEMATVEGKH
jgi:2-methylisocitrate lyase-like PEP mutase family enzyme